LEVKTMARAMVNEIVIAQSDTYEVVEGNIYFPKESVNMEYLKPSDTHTTCYWKGVASYYHVEVEGEVLQDAAWYYPNPSSAAANIKDHIAFWKGVKVER
jgi:uncharacterized protein (DUF427 family)